MRAPVLLVGHDADSQRRARDAFLSGGLGNPVVACADGDEARDYVLGHGAFVCRSEHPLPVVVVTRLRLERGSGMEVLRTLRGHADLCRTPVVVVGGDPSDEEIVELHAGGVAAYLSPQVAEHALLDVIRGLPLPWTVDRVSDPS